MINIRKMNAYAVLALGFLGGAFVAFITITTIPSGGGGSYVTGGNCPPGHECTSIGESRLMPVQTQLDDIYGQLTDAQEQIHGLKQSVFGLQDAVGDLIDRQQPEKKQPEKKPTYYNLYLDPRKFNKEMGSYEGPLPYCIDAPHPETLTDTCPKGWTCYKFPLYEGGEPYSLTCPSWSGQ